MCYNCRRPGHITKNYYEVGPTCLCCKLVGHETKECHKIIAKIEKGKLKDKGKESTSFKLVLGDPKQVRMEKIKALLGIGKTSVAVTLKDVVKDLPCVSARIRDFDVGSIVLDEEIEGNIMMEETWRILGSPTLLLSLGKIGLFKGKLLSVCGKIIVVNVSIQGTSIVEEFKVVRFIKDSVPFPILLEKTWIAVDRLRREQESITERNKKLSEILEWRLTQIMKKHGVIS